MGIKKCLGCAFISFVADHRPYHVHIYYKGKELGKFDTENQRSMNRKLEIKGRLKKALRLLGYLEGKS